MKIFPVLTMMFGSAARWATAFPENSIDSPAEKIASNSPRNTKKVFFSILTDRPINLVLIGDIN